MDIWDDFEDHNNNEYFTNEQFKIYISILKKRISKRCSNNEYYEMLAKLWDSIGELGYAKECRALIKD